MTPDKNDGSGSALNDSVEEAMFNAADEVDRPASAAAGGSDGGRDVGPDARQTTVQSAIEDTTEVGPDDASLEGSTSAAQDDPLGFGDERMHDPDDPQDEIGQLRAQLAEAEARAAENWDRLLRLQAEMENQRKRAQNDVTKARKFALEGIVSDLLPVKDSLEMGLSAAQAAEADPKAIVEGADLTLKMLSQVFEKNNIVEVNPVDEKFDPEFHQAMSMQEIEGKAANTVASVMQKGYTLNDRLVRPALVMVAK